ncbi:hypothetical protein EZS27_020631 [termite gut metagenome]|uniref:Uncharacterized protein n=1 Tax=termite gut metagenome TaxID=433724 RepID=A0A5J4RAP8_9ZZZZ
MKDNKIRVVALLMCRAKILRESVSFLFKRIEKQRFL